MRDYFISKCPHCKSTIQCKNKCIGTPAKCPICSKNFLVIEPLPQKTKKQKKLVIKTEILKITSSFLLIATAIIVITVQFIKNPDAFVFNLPSISSTSNKIAKAKSYIKCADAIHYLERAVKSMRKSDHNYRVATTLLQDLKDIHQKGFSPLHCAIKRNDTEWINLLIANGADINDNTSTRTPPLIYGTLVSNDSTIAHLLSLGANVNITGIDGYTSLMFACATRSPNTVKMLLDAKADVNISSFDIRSNALFEAIIRNDEQTIPIATMLIKYGADSSWKNNTGITAKKLALGCKDPVMCNRLRAILNNVTTTEAQIIFDDRLISVNWEMTIEEAQSNGFYIIDNSDLIRLERLTDEIKIGNKTLAMRREVLVFAKENHKFYLHSVWLNNFKITGFHEWDNQKNEEYLSRTIRSNVELLYKKYAIKAKIIQNELNTHAIFIPGIAYIIIRAYPMNGEIYSQDLVACNPIVKFNEEEIKFLMVSSDVRTRYVPNN